MFYKLFTTIPETFAYVLYDVQTHFFKLINREELVEVPVRPVEPRTAEECNA